MPSNRTALVRVLASRRLCRWLLRRPALCKSLEARPVNVATGDTSVCTIVFPTGRDLSVRLESVIGDVEQIVKVAQFRLAYSRQMFVIAYPRETQEIV